MSDKKSDTFDVVSEAVKGMEHTRNLGMNYVVNLIDIHFKNYPAMTKVEWDQWKKRHFPNYEPIL